MSKLLFIDLESTGKNVNTAGVLEIGGMVVIDNLIVEEFSIEMRPFLNDVIEEEALRINKVKKEEIHLRQIPTAAFGQFLDIIDRHVNRFDKLDKFSLVGWNISRYDSELLRRFFEKNGHLNFNSYFHVGPIDLFCLISYSLKEHRHLLPNMKLGTVCEFLKIDVDQKQTHNALYDSKLCWEIYKMYSKEKEKR